MTMTLETALIVMGIASVIPHRAVFGHHSRYYVMAAAVLALSAIDSNSFCFNFTVICMRRETSATEMNASSTETTRAVNKSKTENITRNGISHTQELRFNAREISWLFSAFAIGGIVGIVPVAPLITRYGLRAVLTGCGLLSAVATFILPFAVTQLPYALLFLVRVLQGLALAPCMPSLGHITQHWSTKAEAALFIGILSCYLQFGTFLAMPPSGWLCESAWGWSAAFYIAGSWTLVMFALFFTLHRDHPEESWFITNAELVTLGYQPLMSQRAVHGDTAIFPAVKGEARVVDSSVASANVNEAAVPYWRVLTDSAVWASLALCLSYACSYQTIAIFGPIILNRALHYSVESSGMLDALLIFSTLLGKLLVVAPPVQKWSWLTSRPRVFLVWLPALALLLNTVWYMLLGLLPIISPAGGLEWLALVVMVLLMLGNGAGYVGALKNIQIIAQHSSHFVMALVYLLNCLVILTMPPLVAWVAPGQSVQEFSPIFFGISASLVLLTIIFLLLAQTEPRPWTRQIKAASRN